MGKFTKIIHFTIFIKLFFINYPYLGSGEGKDCCKSLCPCFFKESKTFINNNGKNKKDNLEKEKKDEEKVNNNNNENIQEEPKDEEYSYDCKNLIFLSQYIYKGTENAEFTISLKNNGTKTWANDTKLINDPSSVLQADDISLAQQEPNEERDYTAVIKNLGGYAEGEYKAIFLFYSKEKIRGEKITAIVRIKKKDDKNNEINENIDKINEFRETYNVLVNEYSNEKILELLKENDFNCEDAFCALFN